MSQNQLHPIVRGGCASTKESNFVVVCQEGTQKPFLFASTPILAIKGEIYVVQLVTRFSTILQHYMQGNTLATFYYFRKNSRFQNVFRFLNDIAESSMRNDAEITVHLRALTNSVEQIKRSA